MSFPDTARKEADLSARKRPALALDRAFTQRLHTLSKLTDRVSQAAYATDAGIPFSEGRCLAAIGSFSPLSVNALAQWSNLNKAQASRAAQSLVDQGLVNKQASDSDGRGVVLTLTADGQRVWRRVMQVIEQRNADIMACLSAVEAQQFSQLLDRLIASARVTADALAEGGQAGGRARPARSG